MVRYVATDELATRYYETLCDGVWHRAEFVEVIVADEAFDDIRGERGLHLARDYSPLKFDPTPHSLGLRFDFGFDFVFVPPASGTMIAVALPASE